MMVNTMKGTCPLCGSPVIIDEYSNGNGECQISYNYDYEWALQANNYSDEYESNPYGGGN